MGSERVIVESPAAGIRRIAETKRSEISAENVDQRNLDCAMNNNNYGLVARLASNTQFQSIGTEANEFLAMNKRPDELARVAIYAIPVIAFEALEILVSENRRDYVREVANHTQHEEIRELANTSLKR